MDKIKCIYCETEEVNWWKLKVTDSNSNISNPLLFIHCNSPKCGRCGIVETVPSHKYCSVYEVKRLISGKIK